MSQLLLAGFMSPKASFELSDLCHPLESREWLVVL